MAVPYHTHTFEIPTATTQDMAARAANDKAVTPSVLGTAATADVSQFATAEQGKKADSAVQPQSLNSLAYKDKITVNEINTNGAPSNTTFLSGNGWKNLTGGGDMTVAIYDPQNKQADAFDMANMKEADNAKILTADERNKIAKLGDNYLSKSGGTITGDLTVNSAIRSSTIFTDGWILGEYKGEIGKGTAGLQLSCAQNENYISQFVIRDDGSTAVWMQGGGDVATFRRDCSLVLGGNAVIQSDGNIRSSVWQGGHLYQHIENRCAAFADDRRNWSVTDVRLVGWAEAVFTNAQWWSLPTGYFANAAYIEGNGNHRIGGNQIQLYIAARGWFPIGG